MGDLQADLIVLWVAGGILLFLSTVWTLIYRGTRRKMPNVLAVGTLLMVLSGAIIAPAMAKAIYGGWISWVVAAVSIAAGMYAVIGLLYLAGILKPLTSDEQEARRRKFEKGLHRRREQLSPDVARGVTRPKDELAGAGADSVRHVWVGPSHCCSHHCFCEANPEPKQECCCAPEGKADRASVEARLRWQQGKGAACGCEGAPKDHDACCYLHECPDWFCCECPNCGQSTYPRNLQAHECDHDG